MSIDPLILILVLAVLSMAPFVAIMVTSFVKIVVVINLLRNALGIQQIPPYLVVNGLAIILSIYIMAPVASQSFDIIKARNLSLKEWSEMNFDQLQDNLTQIQTPLQQFLSAHVKERDVAFFKHAAKHLWKNQNMAEPDSKNLLVLVPAFTVSELTSAFQIGFLIYLPFLAIDLIISNLLLAMGMMMVSPVTISLPFKLLLFVLVDGWSKVIHGLVLTYS